jgi:hypothetical protein
MDPVRLPVADRVTIFRRRHFHHHYPAKRGIVHGAKGGATNFAGRASPDIYRVAA